MGLIHLYRNPTQVCKLQGPCRGVCRRWRVWSDCGVYCSGREIDLRSLPNGVYQIVVNYKGRIKLERIVKQ